MSGAVLVFDMDGVLVDPTETFRRALIETVHHFTGVGMSQDEIVRIKNSGGYNDDSDIAMLAIRAAGVSVDPAHVRAYGRTLYWGEDGEGFIRNERWLVRPGLLERFASTMRLSIFTGRGQQSARHTLRRFCPSIPFHPVVTNELVANGKPAPDGLHYIRREIPGAEMVFVGDNVDDCRAARSAGVRFLGIVPADSPRHEETRALLRRTGAEDVVESVNDIEAVLP